MRPCEGGEGGCLEWLRNHTGGYLRQAAGNQDAGNIIRLMKPYHGMQSKDL